MCKILEVVYHQEYYSGGVYVFVLTQLFCLFCFTQCSSSGVHVYLLSSLIISIGTWKCSVLLSPNDHSDLTHFPQRVLLNRTSVSIARKLQLLETRMGGGIKSWLCSDKVNDLPFENLSCFHQPFRLPLKSFTSFSFKILSHVFHHRQLPDFC